MMVANFFPWWSGSLIVMGRSFRPFGGQANLPAGEVWWHSPLRLRVYHRVHARFTKRIAWTLFSQLFLAYQPGLAEGSNVDFVPGKFRSGTSMRAICVVLVNERADVPRGYVQRYLFLFRQHWERSPPTAVSRPGWSRADNVCGTFYSPYPILQGWAVLS